MKTLLLILGLFMAVIILVGATANRGNINPRKTRIAGCGYTVVEHGIGIDCNGDTVKLVRAKGYQMALY